MPRTQRQKELVSSYRGRTVSGGVYGIQNQKNGKILLLSSTDLQGCENRFSFSRATGSCVHVKLQRDWSQQGPEAFTFQVLDRLEKKPEQSDQEFAREIKTLEELWREKYPPQQLY